MEIRKYVRMGAFALAALVLAAIVEAAVFGLQVSRYAQTPLDPQGRETIFEVPRGRGLSAVSRDLQSRGVIIRPAWLVVLARIQDKESRIRAGEYALSPSMTPQEILDALVKGKTVLHRLTAPEGFSMVQIASLASQAGFGLKRDFLAKASDPAFAASLGVEQNTLEGYLFPDTYYFKKNESPERVIQTMVGRFHMVFKPEWETRAAQLGMTVHQVVTLASIIEKETGAPQERVLVSSVNHNRLKIGMLLQSDPTVIYGVKDFDGDITRKHLTTPTPYNTYTTPGLPPGPIASPGEASLHAALYPAKTSFLYFVSRKDGTHQFSTNLRDHDQAVRKYQLGKG